jgi:hypothetical protein
MFQFVTLIKQCNEDNSFSGPRLYLAEHNETIEVYISLIIYTQIVTVSVAFYLSKYHIFLGITKTIEFEGRKYLTNILIAI